MGTVLSLWDAAELDAAGEDGEVLPKFINLTDASIKMVRIRPRGGTRVAGAHGKNPTNSCFLDRIITDEIERRATAAKHFEHINSRQE